MFSRIVPGLFRRSNRLSPLAFLWGGLALVACSDPPKLDPTKAGAAGATGTASSSSTGNQGNTGNRTVGSGNAGSTGAGNASSTGNVGNANGTANVGNPGAGEGSSGSPSSAAGSGSNPDQLPKGHPKSGAEYPARPGFTLYLVEEFETPLDLDKDPIWTWSDGGLSEGQVRFVKQGVSFQGGKMLLSAGPLDPAPTTQKCSHAEAGNVLAKMPYFSGEMRTRYNIFRYGRYEVRMKAPYVDAANKSATGNFIATLFVFRTPKFQDWRELDIEVTGDFPKFLTTNQIYANNKAQWSADIADVASFDPGAEKDPRADFHDYAFEWLPDKVTWYLDGTEFRTISAGSKLPIPEMSTKIMMNLWVFGSTCAFGGKNCEQNQYPFSSEYEWFRFYKWDGDQDYPCLALDATCLKAGDDDISSNNPCDGIDQAGAKCVATCQ